MNSSYTVISGPFCSDKCHLVRRFIRSNELTAWFFRVYHFLSCLRILPGYHFGRIRFRIFCTVLCCSCFYVVHWDLGVLWENVVEFSTCLSLFNLLILPPPWFSLRTFPEPCYIQFKTFNIVPDFLTFLNIFLIFVSCVPDLYSTTRHSCLICGRSRDNVSYT